MKKKIILLLIGLLLIPITGFAPTWYTWRYRTHATDCTALTDGKPRDLCFEVDDETFYKCEPSAGGCDTAAEWKLIVNLDDLDTVSDRGATTDQVITVGGLTTSGTLTSGGLVVDTDTLFVDSGNNRVGIGTTTPSETLDVDGQVSIQGAAGGNLFIDNTSSLGPFLASHVDSAGKSTLNQFGARWSVSGFGHKFESSPVTAVDATRTYKLRLFIPSGFSAGHTAGDVAIGGDIQGGADPYFNTVLLVKNSKTVGINAHAPDATLEINASAGATLRLTYNESTGSATDYAELAVGSDGDLTITTVDAGGGTDGHISLMPDGNVGIGITNPSTTLEVNGTTTSIIFNATDEDNALQIDGTTILRTGTAGNYNVFLGENTFVNDEGIRNVGIGYKAGYNNDTTGAGIEGERNIYIGYRAGEGAGGGNTSSGSVGIGYEALLVNSSGGQNTAIGYHALFNNTIGSSNFALGYSALGSNVEGGFNIGIGRYALQNNQNGSYNIAIGAQAGTGVISNYSGNVLIGYKSGYDINAGGYNTCLGYVSGQNIVAGSNNIFLGNYAGAFETASSKLIIDAYNRTDEATQRTEAIIYGVMSATVADQILTFNADVSINGVATIGGDSAGQSIIASGLVVNDDGLGTAADDFRVETNTEANAFVVDASANEILGKVISKWGDGTNQTVISTNGVVTFEGTARVIRHLHFVPELGKGQSAPTIRYTEDPYVSYTYAINDDSHMTREVPQDMDYTVASIVKIHWYTTDATADGVDEIRWAVQWASRAVGEDITAGDTTGNSGDIVCSAVNIVIETTAITISADSIAAGDILGIHIQRVALGDGTDPSASSIHVLDVELEYTSNKLGEAT